jgi:choloylglycine hydrolase
MNRNCFLFAIALALALGLGHALSACTGITLKAKDGAVVFGRTLEWGSFDLKSRLAIVPRGYEYKSRVEGGKIGVTWKTAYGAVGVDAVEKDLIVDGMNENGLAVNVFYHPGFAESRSSTPPRRPRPSGRWTSASIC